VIFSLLSAVGVVIHVVEVIHRLERIHVVAVEDAAVVKQVVLRVLAKVIMRGNVHIKIN
jgi:hypothetical protein